MKHRLAPNCPRCDSNEDVKKITYGQPASETTLEMSQDGYVLGGCCIRPDSPEWYCDNCQESFGSWRESWGEALTDQIQ
ncbi:MAG: hypothetical protein P4M04_00265 [Acidobacteriota bacterium]|nr:hypothetical protein [Acidobacteriota bacterium]